MKQVNIYIETDSTVPRSSPKRYGYVLECILHEAVKTREGFGVIKATYHQAVLTAITEAFARLNQSCEVHIYTRDAYVLNMLEYQLHKWVATDFRNAKGEPIANREEWRTLWKEKKKHMVITRPGTHEYSQWLLEEMKRRTSCLKNLEN